jgi:uncharacterized protein
MSPLATAIDRLWPCVLAQFSADAHSIHGPEHWRRVERNGLLLASRTGADAEVVRLFALFHDCQRINDGHDPDHGARGAVFAASLRGTAFELADARFELLRYACVWHTDGKHHSDPTIGACWDADRLDLGRVGLVPDPKFMSTAFAREIAARGSVEWYLKTRPH